MMRFFEKHPMIPLVVGVFGVSLSAIFVRYSDAPSSVTAAYRLIWTVLLMTPVALGKRETRQELFHLDRKTLLLSCVSGIFLGFHYALWFSSLGKTSVASSTAIVNTEVIWVALGYCLVLRGKLSWKAVASIAVAFLGSVMIALSDSAAGGSHLGGDILALLAAMAAAVYMLISRVTRATTSTTVYTYVLYLASAITLVVISLAQGVSLLDGGKSALLVGLLLAVFSTILGQSIFSWCMKFYPPSFVSATKLLEPVIAAIFAVFLFQEIPVALQVAGALVTLGGVYCYSRLESAQKS